MVFEIKNLVIFSWECFESLAIFVIDFRLFNTTNFILYVNFILGIFEFNFDNYAWVEILMKINMWGVQYKWIFSDCFIVTNIMDCYWICEFYEWRYIKIAFIERNYLNWTGLMYRIKNKIIKLYFFGRIVEYYWYKSKTFIKYFE